jgi:hypothetical protein
MSLGSSLASQPSRSSAGPDIRELNSLAVRGLVSMFDAEKQLFCHRVVRSGHELVREGISPRYTIMTLLGLRELERSGASTPFDTQGIFESFARETSWIGGAGDLGLMVWLVATFSPDQLKGFFRGASLDRALNRYSDARQARTMELAWLLAGLAHAASTSTIIRSDLTDLAVETYQRLQANQGESGFFGHLATNRSLAGALRGRIGSFADQIYPIYAMSKFAMVFAVEEPLDFALECASAICGAQGTQGQWWWLYDSRSGHVSSRYPVYSVHQHGMAPMGLFALAEASGRSFDEPVYKGLQWIYGANELDVDMRNRELNLIWRCIRPENGKTKYWETALSLLRSPKDDAPIGKLTTLCEDRPYEPGWLLYAFAKFGAAEL